VRHVDLNGVLLEGPEVRIAAAVFQIVARQMERNEGTVTPVVLVLRDKLSAFARENRQNPLTGGNDGHAFAGESGSPDIALVVPESPQMTVGDAADLLGLSRQAVRALCRSRALTSVKTRAGWEIDADSVAALSARRKGTRWHGSAISPTGCGR
jgi:excisionase family DNA binding protein